MSTRMRRSTAAAAMTCAFALTGLAQNAAKAETPAIQGDHSADAEGSSNVNHGPTRPEGIFGGAILAVGLLGNLASRAAVKAPETDRVHLGNFRILIIRRPASGTTAGIYGRTLTAVRDGT